MMREIILSLVLMTGYDAMEGIQTDFIPNLSQSNEFSFTDTQQTSLKTSPQQTVTELSPSELYNRRLEKIHNDAAKFSDIYIHFNAISRIWPRDMKELRIQGEVFPKVKKDVLKEQQQTLNHMNQHIKSCKQQTQIDAAQHHLRKIWDDARSLLENYTAIANGCDEMALQDRWHIASTMNTWHTNDEILAQLQSIILFGHNVVGFHLMKNNLMTTAQHIAFMAEEFGKQRCQSKDKIESAAASVPDVDDRQDTDNKPANFLQEMYGLIQRAVTDLENNLTEKMNHILGPRSGEGTRDEALAWMAKMQKRIHFLDSSIKEFLANINKNLSEWTGGETIDILDAAITISTSGSDIWGFVDADDQTLKAWQTKYTEKDHPAIIYSQLLSSIAKGFPETAVNTSFIDEDTNISYECHGFALDGKEREKEESKCAIFGDTGTVYETRSITVKLDEQDVKSALARIDPHMHKRLVMQTHWEANTPTMVLSGISGQNEDDMSIDVIGVLVDHLPNNESMRKKWLGGGQIHYDISNSTDEDIERTLERITGRIKHAKSPIFLYDMQDDPELINLFATGKLVLRTKGVHIPPPPGADVPWVPNGKIRRLLTDNELLNLVQTIFRKDAKIIKLDTSYEGTKSLVWHQTYYKVENPNVVLCLQERIEHRQPNKGQHVMFSMVGMLFDIEGITDKFYEQLFKLDENQCNLYVTRDKHGKAIYLALTIVNVSVNCDEDKPGLMTAESRKDMMRILVKRGIQDLLNDSGFKCDDDDYVHGTKTEDIVMIIEKIESDRLFVPTEENVKHLKLTKNRGKHACSIQ